jgi:hypothetical protein
VSVTSVCLVVLLVIIDGVLIKRPTGDLTIDEVGSANRFSDSCALPRVQNNINARVIRTRADTEQLPISKAPAR